MSKRMSQKELLEHCRDAASNLNALLEEFAKSATEKVTKRAMLIGYWVKTYAEYLKKEDSFSSESVFKLKRGAVVRVEFGYRIGRELGGRHYAMVLDANNSVYRNTVTVIPLGSLKEHSLKDKYAVILTDGVYVPVKKKLDALLNDANRTLAEINETEAKIASALEEDKPVLRAVYRQKIDAAQKLIDQANFWLKEFSHMQSGSVAKVDQITTVSKMRISQPLQKTHPLYGVRLTPTDMDKIDEKLEELYFRNRQQNI